MCYGPSCISKTLPHDANSIKRSLPLFENLQHVIYCEAVMIARK